MAHSTVVNLELVKKEVDMEYVNVPMKIELKQEQVEESNEVKYLIKLEGIKSDLERPEPVNKERKMDLRLGSKYSSYEELVNFIKLYEANTKQKFWKRSSRTIRSAHLKRKFNDKIQYYDILYSCIHGGQRFKTMSQGLRKVSTQRMDCPANIKIRASTDGQFLEIKSYNDIHENHTESVNFYDHLRQNRKLSEKEKAQARVLIELGSNKKTVENNIYQDTGKPTFSKDLSNIQQGIKNQDNEELSQVVKFIEEKYHGTVSILEENMTFKGMLVTTPSTHRNMNAWPEFLAIDGSYTLLKNGFPLYIFLVEDSNGESRIAGFGILSTENNDTVSWLIQSFKVHNSNWIETKYLITDTDPLQRDILKTEFPGIPSYICPFHTMKTCRREITCDTLNITKEERDSALELMVKLIRSKNVNEYEDIYAQFKLSVAKPVLAYFNENWHCIRDEWLPHYMINNFRNNTNNSLESTNNKIKQVVQKNRSLFEFTKSFLMWFESQEYERRHTTAKQVLTLPVTKFDKNSPESKYLKLLTKYSFEYILKQLNLMKYVTIISNINGNSFLVQSGQGDIQVSDTKCECEDSLSMGLPCCHIFAIRKHISSDLFSAELCNRRWTKQFCISQSNPTDGNIIHNNSMAITYDIASNKNTFLSLSQKRKNALTVTNELVSLVSYSSDAHYDHKMSVLKKIVDAWRQGIEVSVTKESVEEPENGFDNEIVTENFNFIDDEIACNNFPLENLNVTDKPNGIDYETDCNHLPIENITLINPVTENSTNSTDDNPDAADNEIAYKESTLGNLIVTEKPSSTDGDPLCNDFLVENLYSEMNETSTTNCLKKFVSTDSASKCLAGITMPNVIRKRGPSASGKTVIGLKRKKI